MNLSAAVDARPSLFTIVLVHIPFHFSVSPFHQLHGCVIAAFGLHLICEIVARAAPTVWSCFLPWWLGCLRFGPLSPGFPPSPPPWLSSGVFWSSQCSAGPSRRISGCINGPVIIPLDGVADWLLSSLRFMATKTSALCATLPSTPCCGCCSCAPRSGTEVFALG